MKAKIGHSSCFFESRSEISSAMAPLAVLPHRIEAIARDFARYRKSGARRKTQN
jgi:hypothetical protein